MAAKFPGPVTNILQPKRTNNGIPLVEFGKLENKPKVQYLPNCINLPQLSNQQLTSFLRSGPLLPAQGQGQGSGTGPKRAPTTMAKRNARERNRVKQVNQGFQTLKQHIPEGYRLKKMSKVDTLRCALQYIRSLERVLNEDNADAGNEESGSGGSLELSSASSISINFSGEDEEDGSFFVKEEVLDVYCNDENSEIPLEGRSGDSGMDLGAE